MLGLRVKIVVLAAAIGASLGIASAASATQGSKTTTWSLTVEQTPTVTVTASAPAFGSVEPGNTSTITTAGSIEASWVGMTPSSCTFQVSDPNTFTGTSSNTVNIGSASTDIEVEYEAAGGTSLAALPNSTLTTVGTFSVTGSSQAMSLAATSSTSAAEFELDVGASVAADTYSATFTNVATCS